MESSILERIGLTKTESTIYLTLLQTGTTTTGTILAESGLNTGKIYEILEGLQEKGLVAESIINNTKHFTAAPPKRILDFLSRKKHIIEQDTQLVKEYLPQLEQLQTQENEQLQALTFTGLRGLKSAVDKAASLMGPKEEILAVGITEKKPEKFNRFWKQWTSVRINQQLKVRQIFSERGVYYDAFKDVPYTQSRVLTLVTPVALDIFGDKAVLILNYDEPSSCTLIIDANTAKSFQQFFEKLWDLAEE